MTEYTIPQQPSFAPAPPEKPKRNFAKFVIPAAALLVGLGIGGAAVPKPEPITIEKPVEKRVEVFKTPASCEEAFGYAEDVFASSSRTVGIMQTILTAVGNMDVSTMKAQNPKIDDETAKLKLLAPQYKNAKADCLSK